jgi:imidazolonepropionase-like amidohydrolase
MRMVSPALLGFVILLSTLNTRTPGQVVSLPEAPLALIRATTYPGPADNPIRDSVVLIRDGKIAAVGPRASIRIPAGTQTFDCTGLTITAGFWNSHVHFVERKWGNASKIPAAELAAQLEAMLGRYGFTSVFDTGSMWENTRLIRNRIDSGEVLGPLIRSTGEIIYPKGAFAGSPPQLLDALGFMKTPIPEVADHEEALAISRKLLDAGTDGIKLYAATWFPPFVDLPESAMRAAATEAHRRHKPVFAHPTKREGLLAAVGGGADVIVHTTPQSGPWDERILAAMREGHVALIPTLKLWTYELRHDRISDMKRFLDAGVGQLRAWAASGGVILFGTDVGYMSDYDPTDEYVLMAQAGMSFRQILASLTTAPAERFGDSKRLGRVAAGLDADLVVLRNDPSRDVRAFANVRFTFRSGKLIYRGIGPSTRVLE